MLDRHDAQAVTRLTEDDGDSERHEQAGSSHRDPQQVATEGPPITLGKCTRDLCEDRNANSASERAARIDDGEKVVHAIGERRTRRHRDGQHSREI